MGAYAYVIVGPHKLDQGLCIPIAVLSDLRVAEQESKRMILDKMKNEFKSIGQPYEFSLHISDSYVTRDLFEKFLYDHKKYEKYKFLVKKIGLHTPYDFFHKLVDAYRDNKIEIPDDEFLLDFAEKFTENYFKVFKAPLLM